MAIHAKTADEPNPIAKENWILFTVGNVDRDIGRYSGRYSGRHSVDTRSTLG